MTPTWRAFFAPLAVPIGRAAWWLGVRLFAVALWLEEERDEC